MRAIRPVPENQFYDGYTAFSLDAVREYETTLYLPARESRKNLAMPHEPSFSKHRFCSPSVLEFFDDAY
jgi:hypothetical protein